MDKETATVAAKGEFPSINETFGQSWNLFKSKLLHLFIWTIFSVLALLGVGIVSMILLFLTGAAAIIPMVSGGKAPEFSLGMGLLFGITLLVVYIISYIVGLISQTGSMLIVGSKGEVGYGELIKRGWSFAWPMFVVLFIVGFLTFGGYMLFFIPGLFITLLLMFAPYEVIFGGKRGMAAIRSSYTMVTSSFGALLGRWLLLIGIYVLYFIFNMLLNASAGDNSAAAILISLLSNIFSVLLSWFALSYSYTLYTHAKAHSSNQEKSLVWVWVVAVIGWILSIILFGAIVTLIGSLATNKDFQKGLQKGMQGTSQYQTDYKYNGQNMTEEQQQEMMDKQQELMDKYLPQDDTTAPGASY